MFTLEFDIQTGETRRVPLSPEEIAALEVPPPEPVPKLCSSLEFMDRFTDAEQLAVVTATMTQPVVKLWYDRMIAATSVVYTDPRVIAGLQALSEFGLIENHRVDEILPVAWR